MKKFLPYILILVILIGIFVPLRSVHAEGWFDWVTGLTISAADTVISKFLSAIAWVFVKILSFFLGLAGLLLNAVIDKTVVGMSEGIKQIYGINIAWKITRDLMNIAFIFILVYQGIKLIISQDGVETIRKFIIGIVLASLLINFSLFFTKVIIDSSNVVTIGLYNTIVGDPKSASTDLDRGIANVIMKNLGLQGFWGTVNINSTDTNTGQLMANVMTCILMVVTIFVFVAMATLFITRYIILVALLALSPVAYMGLALPGMKGYAKKWWDSFMGQIIFAPLFMFMMLITLTLAAGSFAKVVGIEPGSPALGTVGGKVSTETMNVILNFSLVIGLMIMAMITSKKYSNEGSSLISDLNKRATSFAGGALFGGAGFAGRQTLGRLGLRGTNKEELEARVAKGGFQSIGARARLATATGSFDARRSTAGETIADNTGVNFGKGLPFKPKAGEGGLVAIRDQQKKDREEDMDSVIKDYIEKRNWQGLAEYMADGKPRLMTDAEWEKRQRYMYKKLNARDRVSVEEALGTYAPLAASSIINTVRGKLPLDEQIKIYTDRKDWVETANFIRNNPDGTVRDPQEQEYIYEKMSPRDRAALDKALADPGMTARLRNSLSEEDKEKTSEAAGKAASSERSQKTRSYIQQYAVDRAAGLAGVNPTTIDLATGLAYSTYHTDISDAITKLKPSDARKLRHEARMNHDIIHLLSVRHLGDLMKDGDLTPDEIREIRSTATPTQLAWMNDPVRVADWTP